MGGQRFVFNGVDTLDRDVLSLHAERLSKLPSSVLCDHLEGWDREGGRETQEGGDMGIYVYV